MLINDQQHTDFEVSLEEANDLIQGDQSEVCEFHSRGYLVELIAVTTTTPTTDDGSFEGIVIFAGDIRGDFEARDTHNVTCIGDGFERIGEQKCYAVAFGDDRKRTRDECVMLAASLIIASEHTPIDV